MHKLVRDDLEGDHTESQDRDGQPDRTRTGGHRPTTVVFFRFGSAPKTRERDREQVQNRGDGRDGDQRQADRGLIEEHRARREPCCADADLSPSDRIGGPLARERRLASIERFATQVMPHFAAEPDLSKTA